jgi:hypothetical protein
VGAQVWRSSNWANDCNIRALASVRVHDKKRVGSRVNAGDDFLAVPFPTRIRIPKVRNVFVGTVRMGLSDTSDSNVCHNPCPFDLLTRRRYFAASSSGKTAVEALIASRVVEINK